MVCRTCITMRAFSSSKLLPSFLEIQSTNGSKHILIIASASTRFFQYHSSGASAVLPSLLFMDCVKISWLAWIMCLASSFLCFEGLEAPLLLTAIFLVFSLMEVWRQVTATFVCLSLTVRHFVKPLFASTFSTTFTAAVVAHVVCVLLGLMNVLGLFVLDNTLLMAGSKLLLLLFRGLATFSSSNFHLECQCCFCNWIWLPLMCHPWNHFACSCGLLQKSWALCKLAQSWCCPIGSQNYKCNCWISCLYRPFNPWKSWLLDHAFLLWALSVLMSFMFTDFKDIQPTGTDLIVNAADTKTLLSKTDSWTTIFSRRNPASYSCSSISSLYWAFCYKATWL